MKLHEIQQALEALGVWKAIKKRSGGGMGEQGPRGPKGDKGDPGGGGGSSTEVANEIPTGDLDGVNEAYTTTFDFSPNSTKVYLNGLRQTINSSYIENGSSEIIFSSPPFSGDELIIDYIKV